MLSRVGFKEIPLLLSCQWLFPKIKKSEQLDVIIYYKSLILPKLIQKLRNTS